jgi:hypothetical protein
VGIIVGLVYRRPGLGQQFDERHVPLLRGSEERGPATFFYDGSLGGEQRRGVYDLNEMLYLKYRTV